MYEYVNRSSCLPFRSTTVFALLRRYAKTLYSAETPLRRNPCVRRYAVTPKPMEYASVCFIVHVACPEQATEVRVARHQF